MHLIDSTSFRLNQLSADWSRFSADACGVKAHVVYDAEAARPTYLAITPARVNDITAAKEMPIEEGATYVVDLGYYDYGWWAKLDAAACRIVTRLKTNTPLKVIDEREVPKGSAILSDRNGFLPERLAKNRHNPMQNAVREVRVRIQTGKVLRILTNDLDAPAQEIPGRQTIVVGRTPAPRSDAAVRKQTTRLTPDGLPVHSFRTLLADLATLTRNTVVTAITPALPLTVLARPTPAQRRAYQMLELHCSQ